ncbi:hypothetical protein SLS56_005656 [Neofusicoccum ribis]|uniref:Amino acid permease/ SLC12A domain-containing protein n=1 Tax=Neofusicoccum ribis TaxID=45134 RepID=A0ABR3SU14_9PEZI
MANEGHPVGRTPRQPLSTIIGVGFFTNSGEILSFAGPATTLLSFGVVGLLACMVMEGISEMVVIWPIPNPMVEFVRHFVDRDLANVVCFAYWYTYAISFAAVITTAGDVVVAYWGDGTLSKVLIFILFPIVVFLINFNSVSIFGWIEFAGGILKLLVVLFVFITMVVINLGGANNPPIHSKFIQDGFQFNEHVVKNRASAVVLAIGNAVYPYIGIEAVTITAFEARNPRELKMPAKNVAYIVTLIYLFSVLGFALNVEWGCDKLTQYYQQHFTTLHRSTSCHPDDVLSRRDSRSDNSTLSNQFTLPTIAIDQTQTKAEVTFSSFINVCLLYSALSTANSALFTASRTLYGLGQSTQVDSLSWKRATRFLATFGETNAFGVPARAIAASMSLAWVPLLSLDGGAQDTQQVLISIGSTSCVLVWASQSLAFVRYHAWLWRHRRRLVGPYARYDRWERSDLSSWLGFWQPALAWLSLVGCVLVVLVFASAGLWNGEGKLGLKALNIYLGPFILLVMFVILKLLRRPWKRGWGERWVVLGDWEQLRDTLDALNDLVLPDQRRAGSGSETDCESRDGNEAGTGAGTGTVSERAPQVELRHFDSGREEREMVDRSGQ